MNKNEKTRVKYSFVKRKKITVWTKLMKKRERNSEDNRFISGRRE